MSPICHRFPGWLTASGLAGILLLVDSPAPCAVFDLPIVFGDSASPPSVVFADISARIVPVWVSPKAVPRSRPESLGSGAAFLDYDDDGDEDILLLDSAAWPKAATVSTPVLALFANDGAGNFSNVTARSGLDVNFRAMGVAAGDYDNDGLRDIFVSGIGESRLWHNEGAGRFRDVTSAAGISGPADRWSTSAGWLDYDNDGLLDLFVCDYGEWQNDRQIAGGGLTVYRNAGKGRFYDASGAARLKTAAMKSFARCLALTAIDLNSDGWLDIVVSNDGGPDLVFRNGGNGTFKECGVACGLAYDSTGNEQHSRGIDAVWHRDDSSVMVAIAAGKGEGLKMYSGRSLRFVDEAPGQGIAAATRKHSSYGVVILDYDLDGWPDALTANGNSGALEPPQLFWNEGQPIDNAFQMATANACGPSLFTLLAGRGVAYADIDGDHDLDVLITQNNGSPLLLRNDQQTGHASLTVRLVGSRSSRDAIGTRLTLHSGNSLWRAQVMPTRGYLSQSELRVTFGLGSDKTHRDLEVHWPSGYVQKLRVKPNERSITIIEPLKTGLADNEP